MALITRGDGRELEFLVVEQFRATHQRVTTEFVVGICKDGESPIKTATREAMEESVCQLLSYSTLGALTPTPGYNNETTHVFSTRTE